MSIFGDEGQADVRSLSDESLFEERQDTEDWPQEEPNEDNEYQEEEVEEAESEGEDEREAESEQQEDVEQNPQQGQVQQLEQQLASLRSQYDNLRAFATKVSMERADMGRALAAAQKQASEPQKTPEQIEQEKKEYLTKLVSDPEGLLGETMESLVQERVAEVLRPIMEERQRAATNQRIASALEDVATGWQQAQSIDGKKAVLAQMVNLSRQMGNEEAWKQNPHQFAIAASRTLWGWPSRVDQNAVEAAKQAAVMANREQQTLNKEGLSINRSANKAQGGQLSPEEQILKEIHEAGGGGSMFD